MESAPPFLLLCGDPAPAIPLPPPPPHRVLAPPRPGLDSAELVSRLRAAHAAEPESSAAGVDVITGGVGDMNERGIYEAFKVGMALID